MAKIYHTHVWGSRQDKYRYLQEHDVTTVEWAELSPEAPFYLFIPQNKECKSEYEAGWKITDIMPVNSSCMNTARNFLVIDFDKFVLINKFKTIIEYELEQIDHIARTLNIKDTKNWCFNDAAKILRLNKKWKQLVIRCLYSPFDTRWLFYDFNFVDRPRSEVNQHMTQENISLVTTRQTKEPFAILATDLICS